MGRQETRILGLTLIYCVALKRCIASQELSFLKFLLCETLS